jgi:hypothetical protein
VSANINVLNEELYKKLKSVFKNVQIRSEGESQTSKVVTDLVTGRKRTKIINSGEYYAVCCPFCNDTKFRCWINHRYGTPDANARIQTYLATCYNAGCELMQSDPGVYQKLWKIVSGNLAVDLSKAKIKAGKEVDVDKVRFDWPGECVPLSQLPANHEAILYLLKRKIIPERLEKFYDVRYCVNSKRQICRNRFIIPIFRNGIMVGWQARAAYDAKDWKKEFYPKYYTAKGTPRRYVFYNMDVAAKFKFGVAVEGASDVWAVGSNGIGTLGASLSVHHVNWMAKSWGDYSSVILFDPTLKDVKNGKRLVEKLKGVADVLNTKMKGGCCLVQLPDDRDPGDYMGDRKLLRHYIEESARSQNVSVDWGLK